MQNYTIPQFIESVQKDKVSLLDQYNFLQKLTDDFDDYKTDLLEKDIDRYVLSFQEQIKKETGVYKVEENNSYKKPVTILFTTPEDYHKTAIKNLRLLKGKIKARRILRELTKEDVLLPEKEEAIVVETSLSEPEIDLSNSPATEKIIYLKELGVLDFLASKEPFNNSVRKLAMALVPILGEKYGTVQPILNPVIQESYSKNNPYFSAKTEKVEKIRTHLIELGFKPKSNKKG